MKATRGNQDVQRVLLRSVNLNREKQNCNNHQQACKAYDAPMCVGLNASSVILMPDLRIASED